MKLILLILTKVNDDIQLENPICKEIIYISKNKGSITTIIMKAIVQNENILPSLIGLETIISITYEKDNNKS